MPRGSAAAAAELQALPQRERSRTYLRVWKAYRRLWRPCCLCDDGASREPWRLLVPAGGARAALANRPLPRPAPAVYELALQRPGGSPGCLLSLGRDAPPPRFKVYVGKTNNAQRRIKEHGSSRSGLSELIANATANGAAVVYRVAYFETEALAKRKETELLRQYNFAWNQRENGGGRKRTLAVRPAGLLTCFLGADWVEECAKPPQPRPSRV